VPHAIPDYSKYRDEIREAFSGVHPRSGNLAHEGLITGEIPKLFGEKGEDYEVPLDLPDLSEIPWLPRLAEGPDWREKTVSNLQRTEHRRALLEELVALQRDGELDKTFWEKAAFMGIAMGEFIAVNKGVALGGGKIASGLSKSKMPAVAGAARIGGALVKSTGFAGADSLGKYWSGVRFGARNVSEEVIYELMRSAIVNDQGAGEAVAQGVGEAAAEAGLGKLAGGARSFLGWASRSKVGKPLHFLTMKMHRRVDALRALDATGAPQYLESLISSLPSGRVDLEKQARAMFKDAKVAESVLRAWDAGWVGALFGGYASAAREEGFDELSPMQQVMAMFSHVASEDALANAMVFMSTTAAYAGRDLHSLSKGLSEDQRTFVAKTLTSIINDAAHPVDPSGKEFEGLVQWFQELRAANPTYFKDVDYSPVEEFVDPTPEPLTEQAPPKRSAARNEEMAGFFERGRYHRGKFVTSLTPRANVWLQRGGKYQIRRRPTTAEGEYQFTIEHATGNLRGKRVGNTKVWGSLEDAMAQANGVAGYSNQYQTDREDGPTLEYEGASEEAEAGGEAVIAAEQARSRGKRTELPKGGEAVAPPTSGVGKKPRQKDLSEAKPAKPEKKGPTLGPIQAAKKRAQERLDAMSPGEIATRARRTEKQKAYAGLSPQEAVFKQLAREEASEFRRKQAAANYKRWRDKNPPDIITRIRERGGINIDSEEPAVGDLRQRYGDTPGSRRSPRAGGAQIGLEATLPGFLRKKGGAESLDYLREALVEEGYLREGSDINDLLEAIERAADGGAVYATGDAGYENLADDLAADQEAAEVEQEREGFEAGYIDLPETDAERLRMAHRLYPDEARAAKSAEGALEVLLSRAPSPELRAVRMFETLGYKAEQVFERLQALGVVGPDVLPRMAEAQAAMNELASGVIEGASKEDVQAAQEYQDLARSAIRGYARSTGDAKLADAVEAYLEAVDVMDSSTGELPEGTRRRLERHKMLGDDGLLRPDVPTKMATHLAHAFAKLAEKAGVDSREATMLYSLDPISMALGGGRFGEWGGEPWQMPGSEKWRVRTIYNALLPKMPRRMRRMFVESDRFVGRMWKGNTMEEAVAERIEDAVRDVIRPAQTRHANLMAAMHHVLNNWTRAWGGQMPTMGDRKRLHDLVDSGAFKHMEGPEDVEQRYGKGTGYLFDVAQQYVSVANEMGIALRDLGAITDAQFARWESQWVPRRYNKKVERDNYEKMRSGDASFMIPRHDISRKAGKPAGWAERIWDPFVVFPSAAAQEGKVAEVLEILHGLKSEGYAVPWSEAKGWVPWTKDSYAVGAWADGGKDGYDPLSKWRVKGASLRLHAFLSSIKNSMAPEGVQPTGTQRPRTPQMVELLDAYLGVNGEPGLVLPLKLVDEIDLALSDFYDAPTSVQSLRNAADSGHVVEYAGKRLDQFSRWWRRSVTIQNPVHWSLNIGSSVMTNHLWGAADIGDFVRSVFTGKGHYADAWKTIIKAEEWWEIGKPGRGGTVVPPELLERGWTLRDWAAVQQLEQAAEILTGGTFRKTAFDVSIAGEMFQPMIRAQTKGKGQNVVLDSMDAMLAYQENMAGSTARVDAALIRAFGGMNMGAKIQAGADLYQAYALTELGFKYAATLAAIRSGRFTDIRKAATWAAQGTADYGNTSPLLRRWSTRFAIASSPLVRQTERHPFIKQAARFALANPFQLYSQNMRPTMLWAAVARPQAAFGIYALVKIMQEGLFRMFADNPDEEQDFYEAIDSTPGYEALGFSREEAEAMYRALESVPKPRGPAGIPVALGQAAQRALLRHWLFAPGPRKGARTQTTDLADMAPGIGTLQRAWHDLGAVPNRSAMENVRAFNRNFMGYQAHVMLSPITLVGDFVSGLGKRTATEQAARAVEELTGSVPFLNPATMPFSRQARRWAEAAAGQSFQDWAAGMEPIYEQPAGERMTEAAFGTVWNLRKASPYNDVLSESGLGRAMISQFMAPNLGPANEDVARQELAGKLFARAYASMQREAYAQWTRNEEMTPGFDQFREPLLNLSRDVELRLNADGRYDLLDVPEHSTPIGKWVARQPAELQSDLIDLWVGVTTSERWASGPGLVIEQAARSKAMDPLMYERLLLSAMSDPEDRGLIKYMDRKIRDNDVEDPGLFYAVYQKLGAPSETGASEAYRRIGKYFAGLSDVVFNKPNPAKDIPNLMKLLGGDAPEVAPVKKSYDLMTRSRQ